MKSKALIIAVLATLALPVSAQAGVPKVADPCASQGSCAYCGQGGIGTGSCTKSDLLYNVGWCARNKSTLDSYNRTKCQTEAEWIHGFSGFSWIRTSCAIPIATGLLAIAGGFGVVWETASLSSKVYYAIALGGGGGTAYGIATC